MNDIYMCYCVFFIWKLDIHDIKKTRVNVHVNMGTMNNNNVSHTSWIKRCASEIGKEENKSS